MKTKAIIEIPEGSKEKIEIKDGVPFVDRILKHRIPVNYGFIPNTIAEDGDAVDIFVLSYQFLYTAEEVTANIIGIFECTDQGIPDNKLFATLSSEKMDNVTILKNLAQIGDYLLNYKEGFKVLGYKTITDLDFLERYKK